MMRDIQSGALDIELRRTDDVERLLESPTYWLGRQALKALEPLDRAWRWSRLQAIRASHIPAKSRTPWLLPERPRVGISVGASGSLLWYPSTPQADERAACLRT